MKVACFFLLLECSARPLTDFRYGRIYCLQVDRVAMLLHSYRFYRDAVVQQGSLPIYSSRVAVSVVDNVLLVHQVDAKVVILYDIFADSRAPISAPLPLLLRGFPRSNSSSLRSHREDNESSEANVITGHEVVIYGDDWIFLVPDLICDAISASSSDVPAVLEFLQRRKLDASKGKQLCLSIARTAILEHRPVSIVAKAIDVLVTSYSHSIRTGSSVKTTKSEKTSTSGVPHVTSPRPSVDESVSRVDTLGKSIKHESTAGDNEQPNRSLAFSNSDSEDSESSEPLRTNSNGRHPVDGKVDRKRLMGGETSGAEVMSSSAGLGNNPLNANTDEQQESQITSPAISPDEIYSSVFAPVEEETVGDPSYLVTVIVEFIRSANLEKVKVHPSLYVLMIQLLARGERYAELSLLVINKILEPSKEVALQLLESGRQNPQTRKLGLDMLRQLSLHHDYVLLLVQDGYYLEALRYARKHKVNTIRPSLFLEAALVSNDSQQLATVLRFFSDFMPGFRTTSDHNRYYRILKEMNPTVAT
ncbi:Colon cancer-associated Mic1-like [Trema orientale]|uniref:Colon cancer-associated Mic1-like n=1 Tax=Trema orientale TaxID=63057 RepID=A0A2P5C5E9_TREOI|nr:Colon cancer-associated Mic1-like [Trema orientale]